VVKVGQNVTLDGGCSTSAPGTTYRWDLGDGRSAQDVTVTVAYAASGAYAVSLTVTSGGSSQRTSTTVKVHIDCAQPPGNPPTAIAVDKNRLCMLSGQEATLQLTGQSGGVTFKSNDFKVDGVNGTGTFDAPASSNECLNQSLSGDSLFPGEKCDIKITASCTSGTTGRFTIGGPGSDVPSRFAVALTCNP
jgi:hypothetical protein